MKQRGTSKILTLARKVFTNPVILYVISRYGTYIIQFVNSFFIAVYLGPYFLGIWGFINLVIGYMAQFNFGISQSVNLIISVKKQDEEYVKKIIGNGMSMIFCLSLVIIIFFLFNKIGIIQIGNKYNLQDYIFPIAIIAVLTHVNSMFSNVFRVFGKIHAIAINQSLYPVLVLLVIPFFREERLLWAILLTNCISFFISFVLFLLQSPVKIKLFFEWKFIKYIQVTGWYLFIYNTSFHLILLSTKSFISNNYSVSEFGYFTFSYSLANAVFLLLNSISFLIFPKMLNRFATLSNKQIINILTSVRTSYISFSHLLVHFVIMIFPLILYFFPAYEESSSVFKLTALTLILYTNSFGFQGVLMANGKEKLIGLIAFGAFMLNLLLSAILVYIVNVSFHYVILSTLLTYFIYVNIISKIGRYILEMSSSFFPTLQDAFPWRMMVPFILSLFLILTKMEDILLVVPFFIYVFLNQLDLRKIRGLIAKIIKNPNLINI